MKKLLTLVILFASSFSNTAPIWAEFQIEVDDPIKAASIAAATDRYMKSDFLKKNYNGSVHLNVYVSNGDNPATHSLFWQFLVFLFSRFLLFSISQFLTFSFFNFSISQFLTFSFF